MNPVYFPLNWSIYILNRSLIEIKWNQMLDYNFRLENCLIVSVDIDAVLYIYSVTMHLIDKNGLCNIKIMVLYPSIQWRRKWKPALIINTSLVNLDGVWSWGKVHAQFHSIIFIWHEINRFNDNSTAATITVFDSIIIIIINTTKR